MTNDTNRSTCFTTAQDFWDGLAGDHPDLLYATTERMLALAAMPLKERDRHVAALLDFEAGRPGAELRKLLGAELRALSSLPSDSAAAILSSIEAFQAARPAGDSMRRIVALQSACRDLSLEEIGRLETLMPAIRELAGLPPVVRPRLTVGGGAPTPGYTERPRRGPLARIFSRP
jgi:hypothetical protein